MIHCDAHTGVPRPGHPLLDLEFRQCAAVMPALHGARLLQIGLWDDERLLTQNCRLPYCVRLGLLSASGADAVTDPDALPVLTKSVQAVLLPHTLECTPDPDALIAEVHRILSDDGQLIVLAFNPFSRHGLASLWGRRRNMRWLSLGQTRNRLQSQGFAVSEVRRYGLAWPRLSGDREKDRRRPWAYGLRAMADAYLILARKRVIPMTPVRQPARVRTLKPAPLAREAVAPGQCARRDSAPQTHNRDEERDRCVA